MTASRKFLQSINLVNLASDPVSGTSGDIYYNTVTDKIRYFDGAVWSDLGGTGGGLVEPVTKIDFDTTSTVSSNPARLAWNDGEGTLEFGLKGGSAVLQIGQEEVALCYNATGSTITEGSVVYINGAQGQRPSIALARADSESTSAYVLGVATENIANGTEGYITTFGIVNNLNTVGLTEGAAIWLSPTTAGAFTTTKPAAPNHLVQVGFVVREHALSGQIFVRNQNGYEIDELHNVGISSVANNDILIYDSTLGYWKNQSFLTSITNVDGHGSGIDADLLDSHEASYFAPINSPSFTGTPTAGTAAIDTNTTQIATTAFVIGQGYLKSATAATTYQPLDGDLTSIAALTGTGFLFKDGANSWSLGDPTLYLTTADAATTYLTISNAASTYATISSLSSYQPLDGDLTAIAALTGTGVLNRTGTNTWELIQPQDYLTTSAAAATYLTITNAASTYLTQSNAASTYLSSATAATTYAPIASPTFTGTVTSTYQNIVPTGTKPTYSEGNLFYNTDEKTVIIQGSQGFEIPVGQREWARVRNGTASTITKGSVVYAVGVHIAGDPIHGHHISIDLADASDINKIDVLGIVAEDIAAGAHGYVVVRGHIENMNTTGLTAGTRIHLSATTPGGLTDAAPTYPNYPVDVGRCLTTGSTDGGIYVDIQAHTLEGLRVTGNEYVDGNLTVGGDLSILGSSSSISTSNLAVANNFIYLNSGDTIGSAGTSFTGSGLDDAILVGHYTGTTTKTFKVKIVSTSPDKFRWSTDNFSTDNGSDITIVAATPNALSDNISVTFVSATGHTVNDIWSGTAAPLNVDLALIGNRNTGTTGVGYTHTGLFFDVSDAKFKFFDEYDPEPNINIDIADSSFSLGTIVAETFEGSLIGNVTGNVNGNITGNAATVTNGVYTTGSYSNPSWITGLAWSKISSTPTTLSGYGITDAQPLDADLSAIAALSGTSGFLKKTAADTWVLDTNTYLTSSTGVTSVNGSTGAVTGLAELAGATFTGLVSSSKDAPAINLTGAPSATASTNALLNIGTSSWSDTDIIASFTHTVDSYAQVVIQNKSNGTTASADVVLSNDTGSASTNYVDLGINSSLFAGGGAWDDPNGGYLYGNGGSLTVGTQGANELRLVTGNTIRASIDASGTFTIPTNAAGTVNALSLTGTPAAGATTRGLLRVGELVNYSDSNILASFVQNDNAFTQILVQNKNAGTGASTDIILANDVSTANANYIDFGMNSSTYTGSTPWDVAGGGYLYANGGNFTLGTQGAADLRFVTGNTVRATIDSNGTFTIPTNASGSTNALTLSGTPSTTSVGRGLLQVGATLTTNANDSGIVASFVGDVNTYSQTIIQNKNAGATASADFIVNNDVSTPTTIYGDFGINSSGFTGTTAFDSPSDVYLYSTGTDIAIGTRSAHNAVIATQDITRLTFSSGTAAAGTATFTAKINAPVSTSARAGFNLGASASGVAPASPVDGDVWVDSTGMYARIGATTVGPFASSSGTVSLSGNNSWTGTNTFSQPIISTFQNTSSLGAIAVTAAQRTQTSARGQIHIGADLPTGDTTLGYVGVSSATTYFQGMVLQNTSNGNAASVDMILYNDATSNGGNSGYFDIGLNSSTYNQNFGIVDDPNGAYVYMDGGTLSLATATVHNLRLGTNNVSRMEITGAGAVTFAGATSVTIPTLTVSTSASIPGYVATNTTALDNVLPFSKSGVYATFTGATKCRIPSNCTIVGISAMSGSVSSAVTVQVNRNGASIGTISLGTGTNVISTETSLSTAITAGDYLSVDVTAGGGSDLVVSIRYRPS